MRTSIAVTVLIAALVATGGCGGNKPKPNKVSLMPAPGIYEESGIDPFTDNDPISRGVHPGILYATDRAVAVSSDILMTLMYGLSPEEQRGLVRYEDFPVWNFQQDYVARLRESPADANPAIGNAIRQDEAPPEKTREAIQ